MYHNNTLTSIAAAIAVAPREIPQRLKVLAAIRDAGVSGLTREEIGARVGLTGDSTRPRVAALLKDGLITVSDEVRRSASGLQCEVLVAV